jgi:hypothetical protein
MAEPRYACRRCGTWTCSVPLCGGSRTNTDVRYVDYRCDRCWGLEGTLVPTMHTEKMWRTHNDGALPQPYPYGRTPPTSEWAAGFGPRSVTPPRYRGVPLPGPELFGRVDIRSWSLGVDAVLDRRSHG